MHLFVPRTVAAVTYRVLIFFAAVTAAVALPAAEPQTAATTWEKIALWPGPAPVGDGTFETTRASLTVHRPSPEKANGAAVVICPGGGYGGLVVFPEGHRIAQWLNQYGIAGMVLEYRLPGGKSFVPLLDAHRAIRTVRARAREWNVDPNRIGIIGFSAGGHLASTAGTHFDGGDPQAADPIDRVSCRPDFMILVYPVITMTENTHSGSKANLLGRDPKPELLDLFSNEKQVTAKTPPTFLAHAQDDTVVTPDNSRVFFEALQSHQVAAEYLQLPSGGHGLNGYQGPMWDAWQTKSLEWLSKQKMTPRGDKPIRNHTVWTDTDGKPISCHDGGISRFGDTFYWYGTSYRGNPTGLWGRKAAHLQNGFNCYSSTNLVDWKYEGVCFEFPRDGWLAGGTSHRPNVLYNDKTRKYVLWFFCIGTTEPEYPAAMLAVATADKPAGPFAFVGQRSTAEEHGWGQDLGLFKDQDGRGYLVYDDGHRNIRVDVLADDYVSVSGQTAVALKSDGRSKRYEGAALIRYRGKYIAAGSGVEGWNPTDTSCAVADSPLGPYREMGLMSEQRTWNSQISNFVYIAESDNVFAMCDQWFRGPQGERVSIDESCQLWLPLSFDPATETAKMLPVEQFHPWERQ